MESVENCSSSGSLDAEKPSRLNRKTNSIHVNSSTTPKCTFCKKEHFIQTCEDFLKLDSISRSEQAKRKPLCINCLRPGHLYQHCFSGLCRVCKFKHHTLLHRNVETNEGSGSSGSNSDHFGSQGQSVNLSARSLKTNQVLLSTVVLNILDKNNKLHTARALLDVGSQSSFLTKKLCSKLQLPQIFTDIMVSGLNETESNCKSKCIARLFSCINQFSAEITCLLVPQITGMLPNFKIDLVDFDFPDNVKLADPNFNIPG